MAILNDIRACLDTHLMATPNLPSVAHQNVKFTPTNGQPYLQVDFMPNTRRPAVRGLNPQQYYQGIYRITICTPENMGSGAGYEIADNLLSRFEATTDISYSNPFDTILMENGDSLLLESGDAILLGSPTIVTIDYAEVGTSFLDAPYYCTPVFVAWYIYN